MRVHRTTSDFCLLLRAITPRICTLISLPTRLLPFFCYIVPQFPKLVFYRIPAVLFGCDGGRKRSRRLSFIRLAACIWFLRTALMCMRGYDFLMGSDYCSNALCGWELRPLVHGVVNWSARVDGLFSWGFFICGVTYRWKVNFNTWMIWLGLLLSCVVFWFRLVGSCGCTRRSLWKCGLFR